MKYRELLEFCQKNPNPFTLNRTPERKYGLMRTAKDEVEERQVSNVFKPKK